MHREWLRVGLIQGLLAHESQQQWSLALTAEPLKLLLGLPDLRDPVALGARTHEVDDATLGDSLRDFVQKQLERPVIERCLGPRVPMVALCGWP